MLPFLIQEFLKSVYLSVCPIGAFDKTLWDSNSKAQRPEYSENIEYLGLRQVPFLFL